MNALPEPRRLLSKRQDTFGIQSFSGECEARTINFLSDSSSVGTFFSRVDILRAAPVNVHAQFLVESSFEEGDGQRGSRPKRKERETALLLFTNVLSRIEDQPLEHCKMNGQIFNCKSPRLKYIGWMAKWSESRGVILHWLNEFKYLNCTDVPVQRERSSSMIYPRLYTGAFINTPLDPFCGVLTMHSRRTCTHHGAARRGAAATFAF